MVEPFIVGASVEGSVTADCDRLVVVVVVDVERGCRANNDRGFFRGEDLSVDPPRSKKKSGELVNLSGRKVVVAAVKHCAGEKDVVNAKNAVEAKYLLATFMLLLVVEDAFVVMVANLMADTMIMTHLLDEKNSFSQIFFILPLTDAELRLRLRERCMSRLSHIASHKRAC